MFEVWNHVPWIIWFSNLDSWPVFTPFLISWLINSWMQPGDGSIQYVAIQSESPMPIPFLKGLVGGLMMISSLGFAKYLSRFDLQGKTCVRIFTCFPAISLLLDGQYERCSGHWVAEGCNFCIVSEVVIFNPPSKLHSIQPYSTPSVIVLVDFGPRNIRCNSNEDICIYSPKEKQQYHPKMMVNLWYAPRFIYWNLGLARLIFRCCCH